MQPSCAAVIVAAGSSQRVGFDKLMAPLCGRAVLKVSFDIFHASPYISHIVIVSSAERYHAIADDRITKTVVRVDGGKERYQSVMVGLNALPHDIEFVAVHDGARPLLHADQLKTCIETAFEYGSAVSAKPVVDTLKRVDERGYTIAGEIKRDELWTMETPQIFRLNELKEAYAKVAAVGAIATDEVSAMEYAGKSARLVQNKWPNPKITYPGDLELAELLYQQASK